MSRILLAALAGLTLLAAPATVSAQARSDGESFISAVRKTDSAKAFEYLNSGDFRSINYRSSTGETALHVALDNKRPGWVNLLLQRGADANIKRADGTPPLLIATERLDAQSVEALLRKGARPNATNRGGETALSMAVRLREKAIIELLLKRGASADIADSTAGLTARDYARRDSRNPWILEMIEAAEQKAAADKADEGEEKEGLQFGPILR